MCSNTREATAFVQHLMSHKLIFPLSSVCFYFLITCSSLSNSLLLSFSPALSSSALILALHSRVPSLLCLLNFDNNLPACTQDLVGAPFDPYMFYSFHKRIAAALLDGSRDQNSPGIFQEQQQQQSPQSRYAYTKESIANALMVAVSVWGGCIITFFSCFYCFR